MNIWLEKTIGEAIRESMVSAKKSSASALSCEAEYVPIEKAKKLVLFMIACMEQNVLITFCRVGEGRRASVRGCLIDITEVERLIEQAIESEDVVSLYDPSVLGGCTFDFSPDEVQRAEPTVVLLVTAWGMHENIVERLADILGEKTFRQGTSPRLKR